MVKCDMGKKAPWGLKRMGRWFYGISKIEKGPICENGQILGGNEDFSIYSFQLKEWSEGITIRKQEEMWDLMGSGISG